MRKGEENGQQLLLPFRVAVTFVAVALVVFVEEEREGKSCSSYSGGFREAMQVD